MSQDVSLTSLAGLWLQDSLGVFNEESLALYKGLLDTHVLPWFGERTDITAQEALAFRAAKMEQGLADSVTYTMVRVLQRILDYGAGHGWCRKPEWSLALHSPKRKRPTTILTPQQERQLSQFLTDDVRPMHLCIFLILTTGMSVGEVMGIQWKDVSINNSFIRVHISRGPMLARKHKTRNVPIGERQRIYLRKLMSADENFLSSGTPKSRMRSALESRWRKITDDLLLPPMPMMDLRHTFAVRQIESGMDYETLSKRLGVENGQNFRAFYRELVSPEQRERLEKERFNGRKVREAPSHLKIGPKDPEATPYRQKLEQRRQELKDELEALEGDLAIIRSLRNSDCVQGANRQAFYNFIEKVFGDDKDGQYLVEYLRCNMRVADMPLLKVTTPQAIRRRVTHGFEKLSRRLDDIFAVQGYDILSMFSALCRRIEEVAPPAPSKTGPKPKPTVAISYKKALEAIDRIENAHKS